jgi:hypothetical protein
MTATRKKIDTQRERRLQPLVDGVSAWAGDLLQLIRDEPEIHSMNRYC